MEYRDLTVPHALSPFVRAVWRLSGGSAACEGLSFDAMPDGCVELIHRFAGRSKWGGEQPAFFVAGICTGPAKLRFSGDAQFLGIRLWPWAWNRISDQGAAAFHDSWRAIAQTDGVASLCESEEHCIDRLTARFADEAPDPIGTVIPICASPGDIAERSGRNRRTIQRWFAREIGMTPRRYMRLLRFQKAVEDGGDAGEPLAQEALALGYADQAHMARDFRGLSGQTARTVRKRATGPFIGD